MAITFTTAEQAQIEAARALCPEGNDEATTTGNWVPFYQKLSDLIEARIDSGTVIGDDLQDLNANSKGSASRELKGANSRTQRGQLRV